MLLAVGLTVLYGYVVHAALSANLQGMAPRRALFEPAAPSLLYYGGMLDPVIVLGWGPEPELLAARHRGSGAPRAVTR